MLEKLVSLWHLVWEAGTKTKENSKDIGAIQKQNQEFSVTIKVLMEQREHDREMSEQRIQTLEREIEALRREARMAQENVELKLRLALSEYLRQLPPPDKKPEEDKL